MTMRSTSILLAVVVACRAAAVDAQTTTLERPDATAAVEFADVRGIRELPDGTILVSDYLEQRVVQLNFATGATRTRVIEGAGPAEARLPTRLITALADTTYLADLGNDRLLVLDPTGRAVRTIALEGAGITGTRGVSSTGELYFAVPRWAEGNRALPADSVRVVRWHPVNGARRVVAVVQGERTRSDAATPSRTPRIPTVGFAASDAWLVDDEGAVRVVRGGSYRVESHAIGRSPVLGPSNAYLTRAVSQQERLDFVRRFMARSPMSGRGAQGGLGHAPQPSESELAAMVRTTEFAERHPMFDPARVVAAPGGEVWVGRPPETGKPVRYDRFDRVGRPIGAVELPSGCTVMAVTRRGVYVVAESELGLQRVERYRRP